MRLVLLFILLPALAQANGVEITRIWPAWRDTASFVRISEYFGGKENTGRQTMLRTQPDARDGFYFLTRVNNTGPAQAEARFVLEVIAPDSPTPKVFRFTTALPHGSHVFNLGLTGQDWAGEAVHPVAWRLRLQDSGDREIAQSQSYLWQMPDATKH
ncbi:MAG: hypothetical protein IT582_00575 [Opitutaceae bacterium]|nr:hypothetical protein [Opitutaceae bacterium]